jgi:hypothetical protein
LSSSSIAYEADARQPDHVELEALLLRRLDSGGSIEMDDADFPRIREKVEAVPGFYREA